MVLCYICYVSASYILEGNAMRLSTKVLLLVVVVLAFIDFSRCAVGKQHTSSIGATMYNDNPMSYIAGDIKAIAVIEGGVVVRVQPIGTYELFTDEKLFCGNDVVEKFRNIANPLVLTYRTKASRLIEGIGCHELISVDGLKPKEIQ
jgi:hypothetical protein